jgi:hypothetical protein
VRPFRPYGARGDFSRDVLNTFRPSGAGNALPSAGCIDNWSHFYHWSGPSVHELHRNGQEVLADGQFFASLLLAEAAQFVTANKARPFFLYFAINEPHYPYQPDVKYLERFKDLPYPRNLYAAFLATKLIGNAWDTSTGVAWSTSEAEKKSRFAFFLSNLAEDVGETRNRAEERPDVVARLRNLHDAWAAPFPDPAGK